MTDLGERVKACRKKLGQSQEEFGERFGVDRLAVANWEKGNCAPRGARLQELVGFLQTQEEVEFSGRSDSPQLLLPFDPPVIFSVRMSPKAADTILFELQITRKVG